MHDAPQYIPTFQLNYFPMFWLLLEAGVALAILILIVWWTWPRPPRNGGD